MNGDPASWATTTHAWDRLVDREHIERIRADLTTFAGSAWHLVLEVLAYARDEANATGAGRATVTLHADGSIEVADDGRGTDTRIDSTGRPVRKPVMATRDVRFFDHPDVEQLADGRPRRGMSVVAASSDVLVHTNRRRDGAWTQRYEHGLPRGDLRPVAVDWTTGTTGTTVTFRPRRDLLTPLPATAVLHRDLRTLHPPLTVDLVDDRTHGSPGRTEDPTGPGTDDRTSGPSSS